MQSSNLCRLIYLSSTNVKPNEDDLEDIVNGSQKRNTSFDITGLLIYLNGHFLQVLEGEEESVERLFSNIKRDDRHHMVEAISKSQIKDRLFAKWCMAFQSLDSTELKKLTGFTSLSDLCFDNKNLGGERVQRLIDNFIQLNSLD